MKSDANIARILFGMAVPAHVLYFYIITLIQTTSITFPFVAMYIFIALFEVSFFKELSTLHQHTLAHSGSIAFVSRSYSDLLALEARFGPRRLCNSIAHRDWRPHRNGDVNFRLLYSNPSKGPFRVTITVIL